MLLCCSWCWCCGDGSNSSAFKTLIIFPLLHVQYNFLPLCENLYFFTATTAFQKGNKSCVIYLCVAKPFNLKNTVLQQGLRNSLFGLRQAPDCPL